MSKKLQLTWGIDPFNSSEAVDKNTLVFLKALVKAIPVEIQPVYISSDAYVIYGHYPVFPALTDPTAYVTEAVTKYLAQFQDLPLQDFQIIENPTGLRSSEILRMTEFVEKSKSDYVLLGSQGHKGLQRMMIGSFTENFILRSQTPVLIVNARLKKNPDLSQALAPVEIGNETHSFIESFLGSNKLSFIKKLSLFHNINHRDYSQANWGPAPLSTDHKNSMDIVQEAKKSSEAFLNDLVQGLTSDMEVDASVEKYYGSLSDAIAKKSEELSTGLIVLKSNTRSLSAKFFGSVARVLIRDSQRPLLIFPVHYKDEA